MKSLKTIIKILIISVILLISNNITITAAPGSEPHEGSEMDSVRLSLLTCSPHNEVYSLYGHTAIRYENPARGIDVAVNYGMFSFDKPLFILRFVFGLTDYEMGVMPFSVFCDEYRYYGSSVTQQTLNIDNATKERIVKAIENNYKPQNRVYRYNYFYDNCTTRARNILVDNIVKQGHRVTYTRKDNGPSFREMIHQYNADHPWARLGNDLLLGLNADRKTSVADQQFLPEHLMHDFSTARLDGKPLLASQTTVVPQGVQPIDDGFCPTPRECAVALFIVCLGIAMAEIKTRRIYWGTDIVLMTASGLAGIVLFAMIFSQHPTVSLNLQILLFNPLPLFFLYTTVKAARKHAYPRWATLQAVLIAMFFIGGFVQCYAEGMYFVALSLLTRSMSHFVTRKMRNDRHE